MLKKFLITSAAGLLLAACQQQAASPPPAAPLPQAYTVYFDTGQSALSPRRPRRFLRPLLPSSRAAPPWACAATPTPWAPGVQPAALPAARGRP